MKILVSGSGGLIGRVLIPRLLKDEHRVARLLRTARGGKGIVWDFVSERASNQQLAALEGFDAMIHLAGENVAAMRWTAEKKRRIWESRVIGTKRLSEAIEKLRRPPRVLLAASAIGYYGSRGDEVLTEGSEPGEGFFPRVGREWEQAADPARAAGVRVVHLRFGVVLSAEGGAMSAMLKPFRFGLGGRVGSGKQWMSWISRRDAISAIVFLLKNDDVSGPVNIVGPAPVTNREFTATLAKVLRRPAVLPLPAFVVRAAMGEMGENLLLGSTRVMPERLKEAEFAFEHDTLERAMRDEL